MLCDAPCTTEDGKQRQTTADNGRQRQRTTENDRLRRNLRMESLIAILDSANEETWYIAVDEICGFADLRIVDDSSSQNDGGMKRK